MAATFASSQIAPEQLRFVILAYGIEHAYRIVSVEEVAHEIKHVRREEIRKELDRLAEEGLLTRFSGRYCFNRAIPDNLRRTIEQTVTTSGTLKARQ
ncbi:MAG TPA: hypothetical protein VNN73_22660 [Blastocatellia bacterium]|nr:hypothetical protein [Blastocatellia bacterium]